MVRPSAPRPQRAARLRQERESQRCRILDAALARFTERGYEATSVHDVAAAAGFSVGHLYNLIGNKEALYDAVIVREGEAMGRLVQTVLTEGRALCVRDRLDRLTDAVIDFFDRHRAFLRLYLRQTRGLPGDESRLSPSGKRLKRRMERRLLALMSEGVRDGSLAPLDPRDLQAAYEDYLQGFIARRLTGGRRRGPPGGKVLRHILWNGIGAPPARRGGTR